MNNKQEIGKLGEKIAKEYIIRKGCEIIRQNYRRKSDEIDIIAKLPDGTLVFYEVKSLAVFDGRECGNGNMLLPEDNMSPAKFRKISRTCEFFARQHPQLIDEERGWRIDLIAIEIGMNGLANTIRHYENI